MMSIGCDIKPIDIIVDVLLGACKDIDLAANIWTIGKKIKYKKVGHYQA